MPRDRTSREPRRNRRADRPRDRTSLPRVFQRTVTTFSTVSRAHLSARRAPTGAADGGAELQGHSGRAVAERDLPRGTDSVCRALLCAGGGAVTRAPLAWGFGARRPPPAPRARNLSSVASVRNDPQPAPTTPRGGVLDHQGDEHLENLSAPEIAEVAWLPQARRRSVGAGRNLSRAPTAPLQANS
jgi:hypothetical protein